MLNKKRADWEGSERRPANKGLVSDVRSAGIKLTLYSYRSFVRLRSVLHESARRTSLSISRQALDRARQQGKLLFSLPTIAELNEVLRREGFNKYVTEEERFQLLATMLREAMLKAPTETITDCRDSEDNKFLELAVGGNADCIVSGDADLLVLHPFRGIPILTPREFLNYSWEKII